MVGNVDIYDNKKIVDEMGHYFSTIGSKYANNILKSDTSISDYLKVIPRNARSIFLNPTNKREVKLLILNLPNKKSSRFDNINNILLKLIKSTISDNLACLFNQSMAEGIFPDQMKLAEVVPLFKSKERFLLNNYRPISLLITISKILEKMMYKRTYSFLNAKKPIL